PHCMNDPQPEGHMASYIGRRKFLTTLGGAAAWPLAARAQQAPGRISRIGILGSRGTVVSDTGYAAFIDELRRLGFTEGQNLVVEYHPTDMGRDAAFAAAAEMIRSNVELIVAEGAEFNLQAAVAASRTIPIVITANSYDPIARGYVASLARPGGNITGIFQRQPDVARKRVELMREAFPEKTHLAIGGACQVLPHFNWAEQLDGVSILPGSKHGHP